MKVAFFLNIVSPHQLPLAREVARRVGEANFRYVYVEELHRDRAAMGWSGTGFPTWCEKGDENSPFLLEADLVYTGIRCLGLMERRATAGKRTLYASERWLKPIPKFGWWFPGSLKLWSPAYRRLARRFATWLRTDTGARYLAIGPKAAADMRRLGAPAEKIVPWGYFVEPSRLGAREGGSARKELRILYIGRLLALKRVDTIILAAARVARGRPVELSVVGDGVMGAELQKLAKRMEPSGLRVVFRSSVPIDEVRRVMREHDVVVFASNEFDGWGAVVSEAMEEGVPVLGTNETGAAATLLPPERRFACGDVGELARKLEDFADSKRLPTLMPMDFTAAGAAEKLVCSRDSGGCVDLN